MDKEFPLADAFQLFILDCHAQGFTAATVDFYETRFRLISEWCDARGISSLPQFNHTQIREYLAELQGRGLSGHYVHGYARAIRAFLNFCVRDGLLSESPFDKVKMPRRPQKVLPALTQDDVKRILQACTYERDRAIILMMLDSGIRANELCSLNVGDVNGEAVHVRMGKGQKGRVTYIGAKTRKQLWRYQNMERDEKPGADDPLFINQHGGERVTYQTLAQLFRRLRKRTGIEHCNAHTFRRTMAINSLRSGMNIYVLAKMMGHADIHVLKQYLDMVQDDVKGAARKHGVVDNLL